MAEIKEFDRNRYLLQSESAKNKKADSEKQDGKKQKSMDSTLARHRHLKIYTALGFAALFAVLVIGLYWNWKTKLYSDYEVIQEIEWTKSSEAKCVNLSGYLLLYSNDGMSCTDAKGKVIWNQTYEMQNPIIRTNSSTVAVGDYNGRYIYICNTQGSLGTINTTMPIRDFCVSANGVVAAVLDDSTVTAIYLYSSAGDQLAYFKTTMSKSGYPIALDISSDGTQVAVSYIKADDGEIASSIGFYNFDAVGQNYTDNLVSAYGYSDAVVPLIHFMDNSTAFAVADNRLMFYQGKQKPESISDILISDDIQSVFYDGSHVGLVFYNSSGETTYLMDVYDTNASKTITLEFDLEYTDIIFDTASIVIRNDSECIIYDWDGRLKYEGSFEERVLCMLTSGSISRYTLVTEDSLQTIELQ